MRIGDIVKVKSLETIYAEGNIPSPTTLPPYASHEMREYFGKDSFYFISDIRRMAGPSYPNNMACRVVVNDYMTFSFPERDLICCTDIAYHSIEFKVGHRYRITSDPRMRDIFSVTFSSDWERLNGEVVDYYGDYDGMGISKTLTVDLPNQGFTNWTIRAFLITEDLGVIPGYDETIRRYSCDRCGNYFRENLSSREGLFDEDRNLCPECRRRRYITPYHRYIPHLEFRNTYNDENSNLYLGVELEVGRGGEYNDNAAEVMDIMNRDGNFIYCSHDSSINNGFEIITYPGTIEFHKEMMPKYEEAFTWLRDHGYRSHDERTCGLHVHFSREYFRGNVEKYTSRLIYIMQKYWNEIVLLSRKDKPSIERYAKPIEVDPEDFYERWNCTGDHDGHYYALNLVNDNTIEFRIFRGTLNLKTYMLTLNFVYNLITSVKKYDLETLDSMAFEDFLDDDGKEYFELRKKMKKFGATECSEEAV